MIKILTASEGIENEQSYMNTAPVNIPDNLAVQINDYVKAGE
jgi:hypothetical protein